MNHSVTETILSFLKKSPSVLPLEAGVQHYAWGESDYIPALLGRPNPEGLPFAELWMGAHPNLPSQARIGGTNLPLDEVIEKAGPEILGAQAHKRFQGRLPYLLKILSAAQPLSLQTHPSLEQARAGFERENKAGIALEAPERNYRDPQHKPELIAALTDLYGLRGFRPLEELSQAFKELPELAPLTAGWVPTPEGLRQLYEKWMTLPQEQVDAFLGPLVDRLQKKETHYTKEDRAYWVLRAHRVFSKEGHLDRGLFSIFLLNLVHLRPGEALYLPAGVLHAYLEGTGVEIMANSNNVLRGGLTPKHVDVKELLANLHFKGEKPVILRGKQLSPQPEWTYPTEAQEFELRRLEITPQHVCKGERDHPVEILIVLEAQNLTFFHGNAKIPLKRGTVFLVPWDVDYEMAGTGTLYKATLPKA